MSASDHLSIQLFHGTHVDLKPGAIISPKNFNHAFATSDKTLAGEYGSNVYSVEPVNPQEAKDYTEADLAKWVGEIPADNRSVVKSTKGFKVVGRA